MESSTFTTSICVQMKIHMQFPHHTTNSSDSPPTSGEVFVGITYSDLAYFQTGLEGGITKLA
jgi:hypothetical protein